MWGNHNGFFFGGGFMWIIWILLIIALFYVFRSMSGGDNSRKETPLEILKRRYASGDISKEEFESAKKDLTD